MSFPDGNAVQVKEEVVLDKWEGEAAAPGSYIAERIWIEDGVIIGHEVAVNPGDILPFSTDEAPPLPPSRRMSKES
jgi:hypothetical protein